MELDHTESVDTDVDPEIIWRRMLDASAVIVFLGGDATGIRALDSSGHPPAAGHTFRIKGVGGGLFHARFDRRVEMEMISYLVWNDKMPETPFLLAYTIDTSGSRTRLSGQLTIDMPIEEILTSFWLMGLIMRPFAPDLARWYARRQLGKQLLAITASAGVDDDDDSA